jgi:UDP-3-O-[3-hydroxymyristoyl] glucosamine N-acyltransferase
MGKTLKELSAFVDGELVGDGDIMITGVSGIREAAEGDITFLANSKYLPLLEKTRASAIVTSRDVAIGHKPIIRTENPSLAFVKIVSFISPDHTVHPKGIHPTAVIGKNVSLGKNVAIGPYAVIEDNAKIGQDSVIYSGCFIGHDTEIGSHGLIYPNVSLRERIRIGENVIIHSGTVIGSDGFGYVSVEGRHHKVPQVGTVVIEDDVEIGANVAIDRARFDKTIVGRGTKIDNLVHIAHNVVIGENSLIVAQVGISGSTVIGKGVTLAGQVGIVGHVEIGDNAVVMAQSGVSKSVPAGACVWGYPAKPQESAKRVNACVQNLPRLYKTISELRKKIEELEAKLWKNKEQ